MRGGHGRLNGTARALGTSGTTGSAAALGTGDSFRTGTTIGTGPATSDFGSWSVVGVLGARAAWGPWRALGTGGALGPFSPRRSVGARSALETIRTRAAIVTSGSARAFGRRRAARRALRAVTSALTFVTLAVATGATAFGGVGDNDVGTLLGRGDELEAFVARIQGGGGLGRHDRKDLDSLHVLLNVGTIDVADDGSAVN
jgi:hypothetical protein